MADRRPQWAYRANDQAVDEAARRYYNRAANRINIWDRPRRAPRWTTTTVRSRA